jgi:hypothetical protein
MSGSPGAPSGNSDQSLVRASHYQSLVNRQTTAFVTVSGVALTSREQFRNLLSTLTPDQVIEALRQVQRQIQLNAEILQDIAFDTWTVAQESPDVQAYRRTDAAAFTREFAVLRDGHNQAKQRRNRIEASRRALTQSWMNEDFLDIVIHEQTTGSTAIHDALVAAMRDQNHTLTPLELIQRASALRLQRAIGFGPYQRSSGERTITVNDIRNAFATVPNGPHRDFAHQLSVSPELESQAASQMGLVTDAQGVHWVGGVQPTGIGLAYANRGGQVQRAATINNAPSVAGSQQGQPNITAQPQRNTPKVDYSGQDKGGKGSKRTREKGTGSGGESSPGGGSPLEGLPKRPKQKRFGPAPVDIIDLISDLRTMKVSPGTPPISPAMVKAQPNPLPKPNALDKAIWAHALRKAQAIHDSREPTPLTQPQKKALSAAANSMPNLYASISRLADAVQEGGKLDDDNLRAYLEGLADGGAVAWAAYDQDQIATADIRRVARNFRLAFDTRRARINNGNEYQQGIEVAREDFETLIRDELHGGWLNGIVLMAALLGIMHANRRDENTFIVHVDHVYGYRTGGLTAADVVLPSTSTNLVLPFHWGNHWTVVLVNVQTRTIRHMDSLPAPGRNEAAVNTVQRLLAQTQNVFGSEPWTVDTTPSGRQTNHDDCGVWVIENARGLLEGTSHIPVVVPSTRRFIAEELFHHLQTWTPANPGPTTREATITRAQSAATGPSQPGSSPNTPFRVSSFAPGPDIPHLPNAPVQSSPGRTSRETSVLSDAQSDIPNPFSTESSNRGGRGGARGVRGARGARGGPQGESRRSTRKGGKK